MPYDSAAAVGGVLTKAGQNAAALEHSNQQLGDEASAFDVWTQSYDGMSERLREFADDPAGTLQQYDSDLNAALTEGLTGDWESSSFSAVGDSLEAQVDGLGDMVDAIGDADGALATVGATFALLTGVEQMLSTLVSVIPFPSLPAIRIMDMDVGLPHAHSHPPNLVPPAPPVPLPSTGPIIPIPILSGATRTLINGMPAARCGDMGLGIWCGGYFPMYEVFLGSSSVWIEGARAGRVAVDITKHCIFTSPKPSDPPLGPMVGLTVSASTNVLIGGVPMPSLLSLAMGAAMKGLMRGLGKAARGFDRATRGLRQRIFRNVKPGFLRCKVLRAEPVNVVTGEVVVEQQDFELPWRIPLDWTRLYRSGSTRPGVCGYGWETPADARLELDDDGVVTFHDGSPGAAVFPWLPQDGPVMEFVDGAMLEELNDHYIVRTKQGLTYHFPKFQPGADETLATHVTDRCDNSIEFVRSGGALEQIRESSGIRIQVTSVAGRIRRMLLYHPLEDRPRLLVQYEYDREDLVTVRDALGHPYRFAYDDHRMVRHTNRVGLSFYYEFYGDGPRAKCVHSWGDEGLYDYRFEYRPNEVRIIDSAQQTWLSQLSDGLVTREVDPYGASTSYDYDPMGRTAAVTDGLGRTTRYSYDAQGHVVRLERPDGGKLRLNYTRDGQLSQVIDPSGNLWKQRFDKRGRLETQVSPRGAVWQFLYNDHGDLVGLRDPAGHTVSTEVDSHGRCIAVLDQVGHTTRFEVDPLGSRTAWIDPQGYRTSYYYDPAGRLTKLVFPSGHIETFGYNPEGALVSHRSREGAVTRFRRGGLGEITERTQPDGTSVLYQYDTEERVVSVTNEAGRSYRFERDAVGRVIRSIDYWGNRRESRYDQVGNLIAVVDELDRELLLEYDAANRLISRIYFDGSSETFSYDLNGNLTRATNDHSVVDFEFDEDGNLVSEIQNGSKVENTYDLLGRRVRRNSPNRHVVDYVFDPAGRLAETLLDGVSLTGHEHDARGLEVRGVFGSRMECTSDYDADRKLVRQKLKAAGNTVGLCSYERDADGNLLRRDHSTLGTDVFQHDKLARITAHTNGKGHSRQFGYDPTGSLLHDSGDPSASSGLRVEEWEGLRYEFDAAGNLAKRITGDGETRFSWDSSGRLTGAVTEHGRKLSFAYDALGRRLYKTVDGDRVDFLWDGDFLLSDSADSGSREFVFRPSTWHPLASVNGRISVFQTDAAGLPYHVADGASGHTVWSASFDPFADLDQVATAEYDNPLRMQGQYFDRELGLSYNRFRYYDPAVGMFISNDPLGLSGGDNLRTYAPNVWNWIDPLGLACRIYTVEDMGKGRRLQAGQEITEADAISLATSGGDVIVTGGSRSERGGLARSIAEQSGAGSPMYHRATPSAGHGTLPHYHPTDAAGNKLPAHVFVDGAGKQSPFG